MMNRMIHLSVLALALLPALAFAQAAPTPTQYPQWDELTPAQRDALITPLRERWNANPDERARMIERAQRWTTMPRDQRDRARHGMQRWEHMSPEKRDEARALFHVMRGMPKEERKAFLAEWRQKSPQQRAEWLKAHPAPERREPSRR
jgi:hypothetical protein